MKSVAPASGNRVVRARRRPIVWTRDGIAIVCRLGRDVLSSPFLHPFAPPELPGFHATMSALTPGQSVLRTGRLELSPAHERRPNCRPGLFASCIEPSDRSVSNHPSSCRKPRFAFCFRLQPRMTSFLVIHRDRRDPCGTSASPFPSRLATTTGRIEFTCVTDQPFAFRCSPPRLAATQFRLATGSNLNLLTRTRTSQIRHTCKRTRAGCACRHWSCDDCT
jgi:hypothetical protein